MLKEKVTELIQNTTAYGAPKLLRSKNIFNRVLWLSFILLSNVFACIYIYSYMVDYLNYNVVTVVSTEYDPPTEFPTVTFCSMEFFLYNNLTSFPHSFIAFTGDPSVSTHPENHFESFMSPLGKCYRFNSGKNMNNETIPIKNSNFGGRFDEFHLDVYAPKGLNIWIHNKTAPPLIGGHDEIIVLPGYNNFISVERTFEYKLGEPYNQCLKDVSSFDKNKTLINYFLEKNQSYKQVNCLDLCFEMFYIQNNPCQCNETELGNIWLICYWLHSQTDTLESQNISECTLNYRINFTSKKLTQMCSDYCRIECDSITYSISINTANLTENLSAQHTQINVFYKSLKYTSITQQPETTWFRLISNMGGCLSLFVGLSFVSIFEIIEIVSEIIFFLFSKMRAKSNNDIEINESLELKISQQIKQSSEIIELKRKLDEFNKQLDEFKIKPFQLENHSTGSKRVMMVEI